MLYVRGKWKLTDSYESYAGINVEFNEVQYS